MTTDFEKLIGYSFKKNSLLKAALSHSSYANEYGTISNERLEFLGDSVLSLVVSKHLYKSFKALQEGEMTSARAKIVCEQSLGEAANEISLGDNILLGRGEELTGGRSRLSIISDAFEALIAAIFLDGGYDAAEAWVLDKLKNQIEAAVVKKRIRDYKTRLQEVLQARSVAKISYKIVGEEGPDHLKTFTSTVLWGGKTLGVGSGKSKKLSEQSAALDALQKLKSEL